MKKKYKEIDLIRNEIDGDAKKIVEGIGSNLKKERELSNRSLSHVSQLTGISKTTLSNIENYSTNLTIYNLLKISWLYQLNIKDLFE